MVHNFAFVLSHFSAYTYLSSFVRTLHPTLPTPNRDQLTSQSDKLTSDQTLHRLTGYTNQFSAALLRQRREKKSAAAVHTSTHGVSRFETSFTTMSTPPFPASATTHELAPTSMPTAEFMVGSSPCDLRRRMLLGVAAAALQARSSVDRGGWGLRCRIEAAQPVGQPAPRRLPPSPAAHRAGRARAELTSDTLRELRASHEWMKGLVVCVQLMVQLN